MTTSVASRLLRSFDFGISTSVELSSFWMGFCDGWESNA